VNLQLAPSAAFTVDTTSITVNDTVYFTDQSTDNPTSWAWNFGDATTSNLQNPSHSYNTSGNYTVTLIATNSYGSDTKTKTNYITVNTSPVVPNVTNPTTGKIWMDRNLGATQVATSSTDAASYGDLYQWGRLTDGHEKRTSGITFTLSSTDNPGHGNFIKGASSPSDWRSPQNNNLWQGVNGTNNPCPSGYRIPTEAEWNAEKATWSSLNSTGAYNSLLKLSVGGYRDGFGSSLSNVGITGNYHSSSYSGTYTRQLNISSIAGIYSGPRYHGMSVRCIKD